MLDLRLFFGENGNIILFACDTFAWFTSTDEVTNRLTAKGNYSVTVAESFQPPKDLVPGQAITKEVSAINTGNIPALVRLGLENVVSGNILASGTLPKALNSTGDDKKANDDFLATAVQLGDYDLSKVLDKKNTESPANANLVKELESVMAGGRLVYAPGAAKFAKLKSDGTAVDTTTDDAGNTVNLEVEIPAGSASVATPVDITSGWQLISVGKDNDNKDIPSAAGYSYPT